MTVSVVLPRDLKAENVLLHQQGHWVLCDFGSTTTFAGVYESSNAIMAAEEIIRKYTTPAYRAPEVCTPCLCFSPQNAAAHDHHGGKFVFAETLCLRLWQCCCRCMICTAGRELIPRQTFG